MERNRRGLGAVIVVLIIIAATEFSNIAKNPRFDQIRTVDVVGLAGCGACIGVALTAAILMLKSKRSS